MTGHDLLTLFGYLPRPHNEGYRDLHVTGKDFHGKIVYVPPDIVWPCDFVEIPYDAELSVISDKIRGHLKYRGWCLGDKQAKEYILQEAMKAANVRSVQTHEGYDGDIEYNFTEWS